MVPHGLVVTNAGHARQVRPDLYSRKWVAGYDLLLLGDLLVSCNSLVNDLDAQGQDLICALQAGNMKTVEQALQHPWF